MNINIGHIAGIKNRLCAILTGLFLIPFISSCTDELLQNPNGEEFECDGEEMSLPVSYTILPMQSQAPKSRAIKYIEPTEDEKTIQDIWILEYHENGTRIGKPRYYAGKDITEKLNILVPRRAEDTYTCVLIANTKEPDLFNDKNRSKYSTIDSLRCFELSTHNHEHVFDPDNGKYLMMSGWTLIKKDPSTHNLKFNLVRNVCKVNVKLTNFPDEDLVYKYFQWRDVPLGKAFPHGTVHYTQVVDRDWRQHQDKDPENLDKRKVDLERGIDFYLPCNVWLPAEMPGAETGESTVEERATHFVVVTRDRIGKEFDEETQEYVPIESGVEYEFQRYPSKDKEKQFSFQPNHVYYMQIDITGLVPDDPFVDIVDYEYLEESNTYILPRDTQGVYAVPITRINRYWETFSETGEEILDEDTEWVAEVIWQDQPFQLIDFASFKKYQCARDKSRLEGKGTLYTTLDNEYLENTVPLGDGPFLPMCFAFRTTGSGEGNVVVGIRKKVDGWEKILLKDREYLWSWHIWITDYNPNYIIPANPDAGEIDASADQWGNNGIGDVNYQWMHHDVPGGEVQKYPTSGEMVGGSLYMMDRNLGATYTFTKRSDLDEILSELIKGNWTYRINEVMRTFGLFYQYGRKDPFPYYDPALQQVYDFKGRPIAAFNNFPTMIISREMEALETGEYPSNVAIKYPYKFYVTDKTHPFWYDATIASNETDNHEWNDPGIGTFSGKKFFDPCPPGWKMPEDMYDTFTSIGQQDDVQWFDYYYNTELTREGHAVHSLPLLCGIPRIIVIKKKVSYISRLPAIVITKREAAPQVNHGF